MKDLPHSVGNIMAAAIDEDVHHGWYPINMPLCASTGPVLVRCWQHQTSTGPVLATTSRYGAGSLLFFLENQRFNSIQFQFICLHNAIGYLQACYCNQSIAFRRIHSRVSGNKMIILKARVFHGPLEQFHTYRRPGPLPSPPFSGMSRFTSPSGLKHPSADAEHP